MPEPRSPLTTCLRPGDHGVPPGADAALRLSARAAGSLIQVAGYGDFAEAAAAALSGLGFDGLGDYRTVQRSGAASCFRIAPDKLWIHQPDGDQPRVSRDALDTARTPSLDLSHARWLIDIEGPAAEHLMARLAALDFSPAAFPNGTFSQTGIHHSGVLVQRIADDNFRLFVPVSLAASIWGLICETAVPFGYDCAVRR